MDSSENKIEIKSASEINNKEFAKFFEKFYPDRSKFLSENWYWLNRADFFDEKIPLVIVDGEKIIGQAAAIPFDMKINGKMYNASWMVDMMLDPAYRGKGLATDLSKKYMGLFDIFLGFPNEKSKPLLKKVGWKESDQTYLHYHMLRPFSTHLIPKFVPGFAKSILNYFYKIVPAIIYNKFASDDSELLIEIPNETSIKKFKSLIKFDEDSAIPQRDDDYFNWRVLKSPDVSDYRIVHLKDENESVFIIKLDEKAGNKFIDIMWTADTNRKNGIRKLSASLAMWALKNKYSYIRFFTSDKDLSSYIKNSLKSTVKHPAFIYYIKDAELLKKAEEIKWNVDLFDSDYEWQE